MDRTIIIGDLHGCYEDALNLLKACDVSNQDRVIFLGDLVDRGPDNDKCVDLAREREQIQGSESCILGNHEQRHLEHAKLIAKTNIIHSMPKTHLATRSQLKPEHFEYFNRLPLYIKLPEYNTVCVHAGVFPGRSLEEQKEHHLLHIQMINPEVSEDSFWPSKCPNGYKFWTHYYNGSERLVFGHSVLTKPLVNEKFVGIDGGSVFGLSLHALILPENRIVSVKGVKDYGEGARGRQPNRVKMYDIYDDVKTYS